MGEYATFRGKQIKIGTCEDMYYLRADQRHLIAGYSFTPHVDRYRFPFPDEDHLEPGQFEDFDRGERIPGDWRTPADWDHDGSVQFQAPPGYLLSIPCPEANIGEDGERSFAGHKIHRNGWRGGYQIKQQAQRDGELRIIVACGSCGHKWNVPAGEAAVIAGNFLDEATRTEWRRQADSELFGDEPAHSMENRARLQAIASRIMDGYAREAASV